MRASLEKVEHRLTFLYIQVHFVQRIQFINYVAMRYYYFRIRYTVNSRPSLDD